MFLALNSVFHLGSIYFNILPSSVLIKKSVSGLFFSWLLQVQVWRRSYDERPPPMLRNHTFYNAIVNNINLKLNGPNEDEFPNTESLEDTILRMIPYWNETIAPMIKLGKKVLIVAHGTVLRGLVKHIEGEYLKLEPTSLSP